MRRGGVVWSFSGKQQCLRTDHSKDAQPTDANAKDAQGADADAGEVKRRDGRNSTDAGSEHSPRSNHADAGEVKRRDGRNSTDAGSEHSPRSNTSRHSKKSHDHHDKHKRRSNDSHEHDKHKHKRGSSESHKRRSNDSSGEYVGKRRSNDSSSEHPAAAAGRKRGSNDSSHGDLSAENKGPVVLDYSACLGEVSSEEHVASNKPTTKREGKGGPQRKFMLEPLSEHSATLVSNNDSHHPTALPPLFSSAGDSLSPDTPGNPPAYPTLGNTSNSALKVRNSITSLLGSAATSALNTLGRRESAMEERTSPYTSEYTAVAPNSSAPTPQGGTSHSALKPPPTQGLRNSITAFMGSAASTALNTIGRRSSVTEQAEEDNISPRSSSDAPGAPKSSHSALKPPPAPGVRNSITNMLGSAAANALTNIGRRLGMRRVSMQVRPEICGEQKKDMNQRRVSLCLKHEMNNIPEELLNSLQESKEEGEDSDSSSSSDSSAEEEGEEKEEKEEEERDEEEETEEKQKEDKEATEEKKAPDLSDLLTVVPQRHLDHREAVPHHPWRPEKDYTGHNSHTNLACDRRSSSDSKSSASSGSNASGETANDDNLADVRKALLSASSGGRALRSVLPGSTDEVSPLPKRSTKSSKSLGSVGELSKSPSMASTASTVSAFFGHLDSVCNRTHRAKNVPNPQEKLGQRAAGGCGLSSELALLDQAKVFEEPEEPEAGLASQGTSLAMSKTLSNGSQASVGSIRIGVTKTLSQASVGSIRIGVTNTMSNGSRVTSNSVGAANTMSNGKRVGVTNPLSNGSRVGVTNTLSNGSQASTRAVGQPVEAARRKYPLYTL